MLKGPVKPLWLCRWFFRGWGTVLLVLVPALFLPLSHFPQMTSFPDAFGIQRSTKHPVSALIQKVKLYFLLFQWVGWYGRDSAVT